MKPTTIMLDFLDDDTVVICRLLADRKSHWARGRQETGYEKLDVKSQPELQSTFARVLCDIFGVPATYGFWDAYLLRYPVDSFIPPHKDDCTLFDHRHVRLNVMLKQTTHGGDLVISNRRVDLHVGDAVLFHPDEQEHSVQRCGSVRLVLSVGAWIPRATP